MAFKSSLSSVLLMSAMLGGSFLVTKLFRLSVYFVRYLPLILVSRIFPLSICFSGPLALFICPNNCGCIFLMVFSRDLLYPAMSITSLCGFFSLHDILIILLMYHISAVSSLLFRSFVSVQHSHPCSYVGFHSIDFGVHSDISVGEEELHFLECVCRESDSFLYFCVASGIWSYCEAQVFKGAYLFYYFLFVNNVTYRNV